MCLAIPAQVICIADDSPDEATVEVSGVRRNINIELVRPDGVKVGDWVLLHVGFALRIIDEEHAAQTLRFLQELGAEFEEEQRQFGEDPTT